MINDSVVSMVVYKIIVSAADVECSLVPILGNTCLAFSILGPHIGLLY